MTASKSDVAATVTTLTRGLRKAVLGQEDFLRGLLVGLAAEGHVLVEGVPGLAKTRAVNHLARLCGLSFKRLQFTPDLLPGDVLGTRVYNQHSGEFETVRGPIFAGFILADEINRAPAKVQSALLETMQERQVTIGRESIPLPEPFHVFATQNPIEQEGTYPLPEAQLDRFLLKLVVPYPEPEDERSLVRLVLEEEGEPPEITEAVGLEAVLALQKAGRRVFLEDRVLAYATDLVDATRRPEHWKLDLASAVRLGASPRGSIALARAAQAHALLDGRDAALPDDVKAVALDALRHRVLTTYYAEAEGITAESIVGEALATVPVP